MTQSFLNNIIIDWLIGCQKKKINFIRTVCLAIDLGTNPAQAGWCYQLSEELPSSEPGMKSLELGQVCSVYSRHFTLWPIS